MVAATELVSGYKCDCGYPLGLRDDGSGQLLCPWCRLKVSVPKVKEKVIDDEVKVIDDEVKVIDDEVKVIDDEERVVDDEAKVVDDQAIYIAFKDVSSLQKSTKSGFLGKKNIKAAITNHQNRADVRTLIEQYGAEVLKDRIRHLARSGVFSSTSKARREFPDLYGDISGPETEPKRPGDTAADYGTSEVSDLGGWTLGSEIVEASSPAEVDGPKDEVAPTEEAVSVEDRVVVEEVARLVEDTVAEVNVDLPDGPKVCEQLVVDQHIHNEEHAVHLPFPSQHELVAALQRYLEALCYVYGQDKMPERLLKRGWLCAEAVELSTWMDEFILRQNTIAADLGCDDNIDHLERLFRSVAEIRDTAVYRTSTNVQGIRKFMADAARLASVLKVESYRDLILKLQTGIERVIEELEKEDRMIRERREKKLAKIAQERARLDELEKSVLAEMGQDVRGSQNSARSGVSKVLGEVERTFIVDRLFEDFK